MRSPKSVEKLDELDSDKNGGTGASACIVVPWFADAIALGVDWRFMAY